MVREQYEDGQGAPVDEMAYYTAVLRSGVGAGDRGGWRIVHLHRDSVPYESTEEGAGVVGVGVGEEEERERVKRDAGSRTGGEQAGAGLARGALGSRPSAGLQSPAPSLVLPTGWPLADEAPCSSEGGRQGRQGEERGRRKHRRRQGEDRHEQGEWGEPWGPRQ